MRMCPANEEQLIPFFRPTHQKSQGFNTEIRTSILNKDFNKFQNCLVNWYGAEFPDKQFNNCRLIDKLVIENGYETYIQECITRYPESIKTINPVTKRYAIHYAADAGNTANLELLLTSGADVNAQDAQGDTPIHIVIRKWEQGDKAFSESLELLLSWPDIIINIPNSQHLTPIHLATDLEKEPIVRKILNLGLVELDIFRSIEKNRTAREEIIKKFPDIEDELPKEPIPSAGIIADYKYKLFYFLTVNQEFKFCTTFREAVSSKGIEVETLLASLDYEELSYLQRACERGLPKATRLLIKTGAQVNFHTVTTEPPVVLAARNGFYDVLSILLDVKDLNLNPNELGETILHIFVSSRRSVSDSVECIKQIASEKKIDVCSQDCKGRTALHIAAKNGDEKSVFALIDMGAKLDIANNFGEMPLHLLSETTLRKYLDSKITTNGKKPRDCDFQIILDYQHFENKDHIYGVSTNLLFFLSKLPELHSLLAHPIFSTVIFFKWLRIRMFFYLNLLFYTAFCFYITSYIYFGKDFRNSFAPCALGDLDNETTTNISCPLLVAGKEFSHYHFALLAFVYIFLITSVVMESVQFIDGPVCYVTNPQNWLQLSVIVCSSMVIGFDCAITPAGYNFCHQLSVLTVLLVWIEFFCEIGNHPRLTFYVGMFRTGSLFLFKFVIVHMPLIFGFALTFHMLFRKEGDDQFVTVHSSFFKTLVMITGEFDYGSIPFETHPIFSRIIFSSFIFLISLVLFNLLIGLAVSATRPIENDTFLFSCTSQIPIILMYEDLFYNDNNVFKSWLSYFCRCFKRRQTGNYPLPFLCVYPNQKNRMELLYLSQDPITLESGNRSLHLRNKLMNKIVSDLQLMITNGTDHKIKTCDKLDDLVHYIACFKEAHEQDTQEIMRTLFNILEKLEDDDNASAIRAKYLGKPSKKEKMNKKTSGLKIGPLSYMQDKKN